MQKKAITQAEAVTLLEEIAAEIDGSIYKGYARVPLVFSYGGEWR